MSNNNLADVLIVLTILLIIVFVLVRIDPLSSLHCVEGSLGEAVGRNC